MMRNWILRGGLSLLLGFGLLPKSSYSQTNLAQTQWKPQNDEVYLQEVGQKITTQQPVQGIATVGTQCFALLGGKLYRLDQDQLIFDAAAPQNVKRIKTVGGDLWAMTALGLYQLKESRWTKIDDRECVDLCLHLGVVHAATRDEIFRLDGGHLVTLKPAGGYYSSDITMVMEDGSQLHDTPVEIGPIARIASYSGTLYILQPHKLVQFDGLVVNQDFIDWGRLPSSQTTDLLSWGNRLMVGTDKGIGVLRGAALTTLQGKEGLPVEQTTCLTTGFDQDIWIGTTRGAVRMLKKDWHFFGASHWLPADRVNGIAVADRKVYVATDKGIGVIQYEPYTLQKKAAYYENCMDEWGFKRLGFIHTIYQRNGEWIREISDNDGGNTAPYLAAMSYKYAVTHDVHARQEAINSFRAMIWLERISPVRGFFARAIWSTTGDKDPKSTQGSGGLPARWYPTPDGKWFWKGDTSSDEVTSHFYAVSIFYDLVAEGKDKELAREHLNRIAGYILKSGYVFPDLDKKPTRWGRWNPEYLLRPYGYGDRGLNGLEVLAYMQSAFAVTGDQKFAKGVQQLIGYGYAENTIRQKNTFPPSTLAPWDDNLAFESYNTMLRYTTDPKLRSAILRSIERTWEVKRWEHIPWFNFTYGAATGNDCELEQSMNHLREWTLDCVQYNYHNSHRDDLFVEPGYTSYEGGLKAISPRESSVKTSSRTAFNLDGGSNGRVVKEPTGFLRDYWMGRYYGMIKAPSVTDPELTTVVPSKQIKGAAPFVGPARPDF